jgi:aspartyl-tRNA synthetase
METGEVEVTVREVEVLNPATTPPFPVNEETEVDDFLRLRHRHLYLRRQRMARNLALRHRVVKYIRDFLSDRGFLEVETPILIKSTPEGARDYLVPSRLHPGSFYALPQSPQQIKQLLMVAGVERYFQIARCFRDEDLRADRQPEFTQLDLEMSFVDRDDILALTEELYAGMVAAVAPEKRVVTPFGRLSHAEALERFGTDKPDLRYGLELSDVTDLVGGVDFQILQRVLEAGGVVKGLVAPGCGDYSRRQVDELTEVAKAHGASGLMSFALSGDGTAADALEEAQVRSPVTRFFPIEVVRTLAERAGARGGDLMLMVAGDRATVASSLSAVRMDLARRLGLADPDVLAFAFVVDFPLFERSSADDRWESTHHPFTAPKPEDAPLLDTDPGAATSLAYDLVCNEYELASGSIRVHNRSLQEKLFGLLGYTLEEMEERFGHLLNALESGAPPHGGIAPGIDRTVMILAGEDNLREVIAFPKTQSGTDLLFGAPAPVGETHLGELGLRVVEP